MLNNEQEVIYRENEEVADYLSTIGLAEYSLRVIEARCDVCGETETGTAMRLERAGWTFHRGTQWCVWHS